MWPFRTHLASQLSRELEGREVKLAGWVHEVRDLGKVKFLLVRDRSGVVQVILKEGETPPPLLAQVKDLTRESVVAVKGVVKRSPKSKSGVEVVLSSLEVLNPAITPLPLDPRGHTPAELPTKLDARFVDLRRPEEQAVFIIYHHLLQITREFFSAKDFIEVMTPRILATATEGGAALFTVDYFGSKAFLAQSPQLYKEQLVGSFERVFEIGIFFRAEEFSTVHHLNEFPSLDVEAAFADEEEVMSLLEEYLAYLFLRLNERCPNELKRLRDSLLPELSRPFLRVGYDDALEILAEHGIKLSWGEDLPTTALKVLGEEFRGPYFIVDWPTSLKPFYIKPRDDDPSRSHSFDLMYGWLEIASGGRRIHRREELEQRIKQQGLSIESFKHHLKCYDYGMPPHAGWGLGLARLLMIITARKNIREVVLYPRDRWRITP
ncbi:MAG: aspartate--tRNA(Asn) ligase [Candidatus Nezhaarchaeota archaeon]|nr:aspartate--tRNA(Asn) ligase [Candidatus Nezhaarchaeota archaeon]